MSDKKEYVIIRATGAGVHCGELASRHGDVVTLRNARRIWFWDTRKEEVKAYTLSDVSRIGPGNEAKLSAPVDKIDVLGAHEIIYCTEEGERKLRASRVW